LITALAFSLLPAANQHTQIHRQLNMAFISCYLHAASTHPTWRQLCKTYYGLWVFIMENEDSETFRIFDWTLCLLHGEWPCPGNHVGTRGRSGTEQLKHSALQQSAHQ
jgi:hypothetical protein